MPPLGEAARERVSRAGETARQQAERVRGAYEHLVNEQPLAIGAIGFALGAVLVGAEINAELERRMRHGAAGDGSRD